LTTFLYLQDRIEEKSLNSCWLEFAAINITARKLREKIFIVLNN